MRKERVTTITKEGRDKDKRFLITELPAMQAEKWAIRAGQAIFGAGLNDPSVQGMLNQDRENVVQGMAGIQSVGVLALLKGLAGAPWHVTESLLDEMMTCVKYIPMAGDKTTATSLGMYQDEIEEVSTILQLRQDAIELHTGFSLAGALSKLTSAPESVQPSSTTPTSRAL